MRPAHGPLPFVARFARTSMLRAAALRGMQPAAGRLLIVLLCCLLAASLLLSSPGAEAQQADTGATPDGTGPEAAVTELPWQDELGTLRVGIAGSGSATSLAASAEPFRLALQDRLGVAVEIIGYAGLRDLILAHAGGRVEYAIYPATAYAATWLQCECIEPLAVARSADGTDAIRSVLIARRDGPRNTLAGLEGSAIVALGPDSVAGYAFPVFELAREGRLSDPAGHDYRFLASAEEAIRAFAAGEGDYLLGWSSMSGDLSTGYSRGTLRNLVELAGNVASWPVIWQSSPIPHRVHAVRKNLDGEAKTVLREVLSRMADTDPVAYDSIEGIYSGGYSIARHQQFAPLIEFVAAPIPGSRPRGEEDDAEDVESANQATGSVAAEEASPGGAGAVQGQ